MKKIIIITSIITSFLVSCQDILEQAPQGVISSTDLNTVENGDKMVIAAYSALANDWLTAPYSSMWPYGSVRSDDAYKGGDGPGDIGEFHQYETFSLNRVDNGLTDQVWFRLYIGVNRTNDALRLVNSFSEEAFPLKKVREAELRFLRGHFYFLLKIMFKHIPYFDETVAKETYQEISNRELSSDELWTKIAGDFRYAAANLPAVQGDKGRATQYAAKAYLAKVLLYQAYTQDDNNNVTGIDQAKLQEVVALSDEVLAGPFSLSQDFAENFLTQYENGPETVFAIQYSRNDGTPFGRTDNGAMLNYPMNQEYGCCGFHSPSHNLVNAFKTRNGLPLFDDFNDTDVVQSGGFGSNTFDPRLDHTAAIPGHPYKYKPDFVYQSTWARAPQIYGDLLSMKETVAFDDASFQKMPPFMSSSKNWNIIRLADVILFKAEALIELGRQMEALPLINDIRNRAARSTGRLKRADGASTSDYSIEPYSAAVWTQEYARRALRWERRLELAMEGYRFFDLVRWGVAAEELNAYLTVEKTRRSHLKDAVFKKNRDEYLPIPLNQINFSKGLYKQNPGW